MILLSNETDGLLAAEMRIFKQMYHVLFEGLTCLGSSKMARTLLHISGHAEPLTQKYSLLLLFVLSDRLKRV